MDMVDEKIRLLNEVYKNTLNQEAAVKDDNINRLDRLLTERQEMFEKINEIDVEIKEKILYDREVTIRDLLTKIYEKNEEIIALSEGKRKETNQELVNISKGKKLMNSAYEQDSKNEGYYIDKKN